MPLLDHCQPPTEPLAPWSSACAMWVTNLLRWLNRNRPADHYRPLCAGRLSLEAEALIADHPIVLGSGSAAAPQAPPPASAFEVAYLDTFAVRVHDDRAKMKLVAAVEFLSPWVKECPRKRTRFLAKCLGYLNDGIGLVVVDVVTDRPASPHNDLMTLLGSPPAAHLPGASTYVAAYRPTLEYDLFRLDVWPSPVDVGEPLPQVPLFLKDGPCVMLDLESPYTTALADYPPRPQPRSSP